MSTTFDKVQAEALKLSETERADLADLLWTSIVERAEVDAAWDAEIRRRIAALDAGLTDGSSAEDVFNEARRIVDSGRA